MVSSDFKDFKDDGKEVDMIDLTGSSPNDVIIDVHKEDSIMIQLEQDHLTKK